MSGRTGTARPSAPFADSYSPPESQDDPAVCGACRRAWGSVLVPPRAGHFSVLNTSTGKYHSSRGDDGMTDCGKDATHDNYLWPS